MARLQQVGEAGVAVGHVALRAALHIGEGHDDVAQRAQRLVDAGCLAQPLVGRPRRLLPLAACITALPELLAGPIAEMFLAHVRTQTNLPVHKMSIS